MKISELQNLIVCKTNTKYDSPDEKFMVYDSGVLITTDYFDSHSLENFYPKVAKEITGKKSYSYETWDDAEVYETGREEWDNKKIYTKNNEGVWIIFINVK